MSKIPTIKEFLSSKKWDPQDSLQERYYKSMIEFAKLHVEAALKKAHNNQQLPLEDLEFTLNAYQLELIK